MFLVCGQLSTIPTSRFASDFEVIGYIGKGGFGQVLKVRNKLDGVLYAVKIIKVREACPSGAVRSLVTVTLPDCAYLLWMHPQLEDDFQNRKMLREVTTISRLYHRHIVRYYQVETSLPICDKKRPCSSIFATSCVSPPLPTCRRRVGLD